MISFLLGGRDPAVRSVFGLETAQRNVAAAILVASLNFPRTMTLPFVMVASIVLPLILIPTAKRLGGRSEPAAPLPGQANGVMQPASTAPDASAESRPESK